MKEFGKLLTKIFGYLLYFVLIAGGLCGIAFIIFNIIGGGEGSWVEGASAVIKSNIFPIIIRFAALDILIGLIGMYLTGEKALSMDSDKKEAEDELKAIKAEQAKQQ